MLSSQACACCEVQLAQLKTNARKFITDFKKIHDHSHDTGAGMAEICLSLLKLEYKFLGGNYSTDLNDARCKLTDYLGSIVDPIATLSTYYDSTEADYNSLLKLAGEFTKNNDLTCRASLFLKGCEAELNAIKCELAVFVKELKPNRDNTVAYLQGRRQDIKNAFKLVESFVSTNDLTCGKCGCSGSGKGDYCKLRIAANEFFVAFNKIHWSSYIRAVNMQYISDDITTRVSTLNVKYSCF